MANIDFSPALVVAPDDPVGDVIRRMQTKRCGCAVVVHSAPEGATILGTFTERAVVGRVLAEQADLKTEVKHFVNTDAPSIGPHDSVADAVHKMHEKRVRHVPVWNGHAVAGVLSVRDIIALVAQYNPEEIYNLPPRAHQRMDRAEGA